MEDIPDNIKALLAQQSAETLAAQKAIADSIYQQLEALTSLTSILPIRYPLPAMRGWAISPDFGLLLVSEILNKKPHVVVELGSGVSTLLIAYCLELLGHGRVVSYDHDAKYCAQSCDNIKRHNLGRFAEVVHAPLASVQLDQGQWDWYDTTKINKDEPLDILVIDGPPGQIQTNSRYPALPLLHTLFSASATVLMDDAARPDEKTIVDSWTQEFPEFTSEFIHAEKGAAILRRCR